MILETDLPLNKFSEGKVRDIYDLDDKLLIVSTDRISAFDCVLPTGIPDKGRVLNQISAYWFDYTEDIIDNHMITTDETKFPRELDDYRERLKDRAMLVQKADRLDVECVVRGYLSGSGLREYRESGKVCGIELPSDLRESDELPEPIFTPATKAETGHDQNVSLEYVEELLGEDLARKLKEKSIEIYEKARDHAREKGIIIADTKFEFGLIDDELILIDEVLTPDSSRFWPRESYEPGKSQKSLDKQFVRDYLEELDWDKSPPAPELPREVVEKSREKYLEVYEILTGDSLD